MGCVTSSERPKRVWERGEAVVSEDLCWLWRCVTCENLDASCRTADGRYYIAFRDPSRDWHRFVITDEVVDAVLALYDATPSHHGLRAATFRLAARRRFRHRPVKHLRNLAPPR